MNRTTIPNPHDPEKTIVRCQLNEDDMRVWIGDTGLKHPPVGFRGYMRLSGNILEYGLEPIEAGPGVVKPPAGGDDLDGLTVPDLQTKCAMRSIKYDKKTDGKVELIQLLRAKA